jgi:hypothetical protein
MASKAVTWGPSVQVREEDEDGQRVNARKPQLGETPAPPPGGPRVEASLLAHGFIVAQIIDLVRARERAARVRGCEQSHDRGRAGADHSNWSASISEVRVLHKVTPAAIRRIGFRLGQDPVSVSIR